MYCAGRLVTCTWDTYMSKHMVFCHQQRVKTISSLDFTAGWHMTMRALHLHLNLMA